MCRSVVVVTVSHSNGPTDIRVRGKVRDTSEIQKNTGYIPKDWTEIMCTCMQGVLVYKVSNNRG